MILIKNGRVIDATGDRVADVLIGDDGAIAQVGTDLTLDPSADGTGVDGPSTIDATGCVVAPGFVDLHAHLRQPGREDAETIETGARGAALGGYTAVVAMPNTSPCMDSAAVIHEVLDLGSTAVCEIVPSGAITIGREGEALSPMAELADLGVRIFTDDGTGVQDDQLMKRALEYSLGLKPADGAPITLAQHCEVTSLSNGGCMHEGEWSSKLGIPGQPAEAEELMVQRDIALSRSTGARVHFQHMSTGRSVQLIRDAKAEGLAVTAEATTHHFTLTDAECATYDPVYKVHPPLRTAADVEAVKRGLADGTIDAIATDHAPHTQPDKELPFDQAPPGMLGLESALALSLTELDLELADVLALMSWKPAKIAGIDDRHGGPIEPGRRANVVVFDPEEQWTITGEAMASKSANCPYEGKTVHGKVRHTVYEGELVVKDQEAQR